LVSNWSIARPQSSADVAFFTGTGTNKNVTMDADIVANTIQIDSAAHTRSGPRVTPVRCI